MYKYNNGGKQDDESRMGKYFLGISQFFLYNQTALNRISLLKIITICDRSYWLQQDYWSWRRCLLKYRLGLVCLLLTRGDNQDGIGLLLQQLKSQDWVMETLYEMTASKHMSTWRWSSHFRMNFWSIQSPDSCNTLAHSKYTNHGQS